VLVQSAEPGKWVALDDWLGYLCQPVETQRVSLDTLLRCGRSCTYRLACNPTVTRGGKRFGLARESEQVAWLQRQGLKHGFALTAVRVGRSERITVSQGHGGRRITVQVVQFDGTLRVVDPGSVAIVLVQGIGHTKALGLGMLSLAPSNANEVS
jgi:CRISPR system Cascade subunit CasE